MIYGKKILLLTALIKKLFPYRPSSNVHFYNVISYYMTKGAELASATVPWHWLFFCLALKLYYENLPRNYDTQKYLSKKLWSLEVGLVDFSPEWRPLQILYHLILQKDFLWDFLWERQEIC